MASCVFFNAYQMAMAILFLAVKEERTEFGRKTNSTPRNLLWEGQQNSWHKLPHIHIHIIMRCRRSFSSWKSWRKLHPNWRESVSLDQRTDSLAWYKPLPQLLAASMSVKDVLQSLVDDGMVDSDRIGTSNYFWAFPSKASNQVPYTTTTSCTTTQRRLFEYHYMCGSILSEKTKAGGLERTTGREREEETVTRRASQNCFCW